VVLRIVAEILLAPLLVGGSTLAARRWGHAIGGVLSALPAVVGPVLLITAELHQPEYTARAANGTLLGLGSLAAFALVYARVAVHTVWPLCVLIAWLAAALTALLVGSLAGGAGFPMGLLVAAVTLTAAYRAMPPTGVSEEAVASRSRWAEVRLRMALTTVLVGTLVAASDLFGALVGGMLAALPVIASVLAASTHQRGGAAPVVALLRGMLAGMAGFVGFCSVVAGLIEPWGVAAAFGAATVTAVSVQFSVLTVGHRRRRSETCGGQLAATGPPTHLPLRQSLPPDSLGSGARIGTAEPGDEAKEPRRRQLQS
jgi:hypothetical protein